jgi:hypothetical protein
MPFNLTSEYEIKIIGYMSERQSRDGAVGAATG